MNLKCIAFFVFCITLSLLTACGCCFAQSGAKYPYRFNTYTPHIYVDAFLNDSLPIRMVYDCAASFVFLDSTFVDNHYGYESKQTMAFEGVGTSGRQLVKAFLDWNITIAGKKKEFPVIPAPNLRNTFTDSIDGVIGLVFIGNHVWAFDFGTQSFDILPAVPDSVKKNWHAMKMFYRDKMYYFEAPATLFVTDSVKISGRLLFDSGMGADLCLFADVTPKLNLESLDIDRETIVSKGASGNSTGESFVAKRIVMPNFTADSISVRAKTDAAGHASKAPAKDVIGYFGFGLLQRMGEVVIDFPNKVLYFKPQ